MIVFIKLVVSQKKPDGYAFFTGRVKEKMVPLNLIGLSVIVLAWILEFFFMGKRKKISPIFIGVYIIGVGVLVYDGFTSKAIELGIVNLLSLVAAAIVLGKSMVEGKAGD